MCACIYQWSAFAGGSVAIPSRRPLDAKSQNAMSPQIGPFPAFFLQLFFLPFFLNILLP